MWFFRWIFETFSANALIFKIDLVSFGLFFLAAVLAFCCDEPDFFPALSAVIGGIAFAVIFSVRATASASVLGCASLLVAFGFQRFLLVLAFRLRAKRKARRARREEILRKLKFTLPDRENAFVQARLHTALQPAPQKEETGGEKVTFRLEHARALLAKIKNAPLSKTERMEAEELTKLFNGYLKKSECTAEDVRILNETFGYLLKLSAKYSV